MSDALNAANSAKLNEYVNMTNVAIMNSQTHGKDPTMKGNLLNPEYFYNMQLMDTIRLDQDQYVYYRYAEELPINGKADKIQVRRWTPLRANTTPLTEGVPPLSDRASAEAYEIPTYQYGRFMMFTDKVDFKVVDPIVANYAKEYSIVAIETLDMLAREALSISAQPYYAGFSDNNLSNFTTANTPSMHDLRAVQLKMKKALVKPRSDKHYHVIAGSEFYFDMITDPLVEKYMRFNKDTYTMYSDNALVPMFGLAFYETLAAPDSSTFVDANGKKCIRVMAELTLVAGGTKTIFGTGVLPDSAEPTKTHYADARTGVETSYDPNIQEIGFFNIKNTNSEKPGVFVTLNGEIALNRVYDWVEVVYDTETGEAVGTSAVEFAEGDTIADSALKQLKIAEVFVLGKDALVRTALTGEGNTQMIVKGLGSAGTNDPLDQKQSIGFKINSVGFGSARAEAIARYFCVPTTLNL